jgi:hypothetical protein
VGRVRHTVHTGFEGKFFLQALEGVSSSWAWLSVNTSSENNLRHERKPWKRNQGPLQSVTLLH